MRSASRSTVFFVSALVAGAVTVVLLMTFTGDDESSDTPPSFFRTPSTTALASSSPDDEPTEDPALFATESQINSEGGYSFDHPPSWEVVTDGTVSTVTSPKEDVVIRIGFAPQGTLADAATELSNLVRSSYEVLRMDPPRQATIGGASALVFGGRANNDDDTAMRFEITTVKGSEGENYAITIFSYPDLADRSELTIAEVVTSFTIGGSS